MNKLLISTTSQVYYVEIQDIVRIQSLSNYSKIFFNNGKSMIVSKVLAYYDELLADFHFVRVHRTHLVNLACIKQYESGSINRISLTNDEVVPVARSKKKGLRHEMKMLSLQLAS